MKTTILFICIENSCRSQIAEGFAKHIGINLLEPFSAGSKPSGKVNGIAIQVMKEKNIDISYQKPKGLHDLPTINFDYLITMGCGDSCPMIKAKNKIDWNIPDPKGKDIEFFRKIRDEIENKIFDLIRQLEMEEDNA